MEEKKNNKAEKIKNIVGVASAAAVFFGIGVYLLAAQRPTVSETEKRKLNEFPEFSLQSLISGEYAQGVKEWYDDTVPYRDKWKDVGSKMLELSGVRAGDAKFYGSELTKYSDLETETEKKTEAVTERINENESGKEQSTEKITEPVTEAETKITKDDLPEEGEDGMISNNILVYKKRAIMLYGGSLSNAERYSGYVNSYKRDLGEGVRVYSMTVPTSVAYYLPEKYLDYTRDQKKDIDHMAGFYEGVEYVDAYGTLLSHKDEDIYLRTDHHWQPLGAYYVAQNFCKQAGVSFNSLSEYEKIEVEGYVGSMYGYTGDAVLLDNPETFIYYKPQNNYDCYYYDLNGTNPQKGKLFFKTSVNGSYCSFLGTDRTVAQIVSSNKNGRKLMVIKDSYGNALVPFLTGSFEEVWVIDMRYFEANTIEFIKEKGITDLLFASCMFSACGGNAKYIEYLRTLEAETTATETQTETQTEAQTEAVTEAVTEQSESQIEKETVTDIETVENP